MTKPTISPAALGIFKERIGDKKMFSQALMPVRGEKGFRKLTYEFAKTLDADAIAKKCADHGLNGFGLVVKDTDGATVWKTEAGWNPTGIDMVQDFQDACQRYNLFFTLSVTSMNDAYRGAVHPESVSIHAKKGKHYKAGAPATHKEGEMRVDIPEGMTLDDMQKLIPFLTSEKEEVAGKSRGSRGTGYIPLTSFHCPRSEHVDYMLSLVKELVTNYHPDAVFADYIRYDGSYTDLCDCPRCRDTFGSQYPGKKMGSREWKDFREDNIADYGKKFNATVKEVDEKIITGWFNLPAPKIFTRDRIAQNYTKLGAAFDAPCPMVYPYLMGTADDGRRWRMLGDIALWFTNWTMATRFHEYGDKPVLCITNSVECNAEEMLRSCQAYDYGLGIALFKYFGTSDAQWKACKLYGDVLKTQKTGDPAPSEDVIRDILMQVYKEFPPKNPKLLKWKPE
ncbi:MAG TPA: alpha-L-fucosidase [Candidatus Lokiarchaeia archaeon]|nr:alpha-L-fucosidase [Candidatus Lokiarchaeia archaeon]